MNPEDGWYIEWVDADGALRWSGFVEGFDAAWDKFIELKQAASEANWKGFGVFKEDPVGRVRVGAAKNATMDQLDSFYDAFGFGPEGYVGLDAAIKQARDQRGQSNVVSLSGDIKDLAGAMIEEHGESAEAWARALADAARRAGNNAKAVQWDRLAEAIVQVRASTPSGPAN